MTNIYPERISTISEYHQALGLSKPEHPLISVINLADIKRVPGYVTISLIFDFYVIALNFTVDARVRYGQQDYDFDQGIISFMSPNQVFTIEYNDEDSLPSGWLIAIHPDFIWNTPLANNIKNYKFFDYAVNEALYISEKEEHIITGVIRNIEHEYHSSIDKFSQDIIIAQLEVLLNYSERFYQRQFITRKISNHKTLDKLETVLDNYFKSESINAKGLPTASYIASQLNLSPGYLGEMLKSLTGLNTQQHIHNKVIDIAKEKLSTTSLSVSEIAYALGFEHLQSFSKLFKSKTKVSPMEFRQSFN